MKKTMIFALLMLTGTAGSYAQVTIGNDTYPAATLDVVASKTDGTTAEGVIAPRLTLTQLAAADDKYLPAQTGAIVYVKDVSGTTTTKTTKVTAIGYYYFDGAVWQAMVPAGTEPWRESGTTNQATANTQNIYQMGQVTVGSNKSSSSFGGFTIVTTPTNGIGNNYMIDNYIEGAPALAFRNFGVGAEGNINNLQPGRQLFHLISQGRVNGAMTSLSSILATYTGNGTTVSSNLRFATSGAAKMVIDSIGNVGIGDTSPASKLEVNGAITNTVSFDAVTNTTIDFSQSNLVRTKGTGPFTLQNIKDGGVYKLLVNTSTTSSTTISAAGFTPRRTDRSGTGTGYRMYTITVIDAAMYIDIDLYQ